mmetsp:Transcript_7861/g.15618  ORF Transcript_7861/g.15618 Transcript_7861/m.15618 type:complete len:134 (+) Transcript_7861:848-1249(+)
MQLPLSQRRTRCFAAHADPDIHFEHFPLITLKVKFLENDGNLLAFWVAFLGFTRKIIAIGAGRSRVLLCRHFPSVSVGLPNNKTLENSLKGCFDCCNSRICLGSICGMKWVCVHGGDGTEHSEYPFQCIDTMQ